MKSNDPKALMRDEKKSDEDFRGSHPRRRQMKIKLDIAQLATTFVMLLVGFLLSQNSITLGMVGTAITNVALEGAVKRLFDAIQAKFADDNDLMSQEILHELKKRPGDIWLRSQLEAKLAVKLTRDKAFRREVIHLLNEVDALAVTPKGLSSLPPAALHQLPADIDEFTGRNEEVAILLAGAKPGGTAPSLLVVTGIGGSGKSALARHTAHLLREQYPDIQLYVDLQGAGVLPMHSGDALAGFLRAMGMEESRIPLNLDERARMYRSQLSGKRALILLDNARNEEQVVHLIPGESTCLVLVTSRWSLSNLEGKTAEVRLKVLAKTDALALLERSIGKERISAEPEAAERIINLCGCLPLAVRIAAGQLKFTGEKLGRYASALDNEQERLKNLHQGNLDVWASFMLSYWHLGRRGARLFRLLGLLPGESFTSEAAAALVVYDQKLLRDFWERLTGVAQINRETLSELLNRLVDMQWLEPIGGGRYSFHDLMRVFARERIINEKPVALKAARRRLARWYVGQTKEMNDWLVPEMRNEKLEKLVGTMPTAHDEVSRSEVLNALTWFEMERANLLASVEWAYECKDWATTWRLAENLSNFYNIRCYWKDWVQTHALALEATRKGHSAKDEGIILNLLGNVYRLQSRWDDSVNVFQKALGLHRRLKNPVGESIALNLLANVYRLQGRWDEAIAALQEALEINRKTENYYGISITLGGLGNVYRMQGRWEDALRVYEESLDISLKREDLRGESISRNNRGLVYSKQGRLDEADADLAKSISICSEMKFPKGSCVALRTQGEVRMLQGRWDEAVESLTRSLEIARRQEDLRCLSQTLTGLGEWHTQQMNWREASRCFEEAHSILNKIGDRHGVGLVLRSMGKLHTVQDRAQEAETAWKDSLQNLQPESPEYKEVTNWLQSAERRPSLD